VVTSELHMSFFYRGCFGGCFGCYFRKSISDL